MNCDKQTIDLVPLESLEPVLKLWGDASPHRQLAPPHRDLASLHRDLGVPH